MKKYLYPFKFAGTVLFESVIINCNGYMRILFAWGIFKISQDSESRWRKTVPYGIHCQEFIVKMPRRWCSMLASLLALLTSLLLLRFPALCAFRHDNPPYSTYLRDPRITSSSSMHASPFYASPSHRFSPTKIKLIYGIPESAINESIDRSYCSGVLSIKIWL